MIDLMNTLRQIEMQLAGHPDAERGNSRVHFALMKTRSLLAPVPGVRTYLDASTAHITQDDDTRLRAWAALEPEDSKGSAPSRTIGHAYGYFVHVALDETAEEHDSDAREAGMSDGFFALMKYARQHGCCWINLDRDADQIDGLPTFNW
jgi:hypothetical protein